jgi:signal transduction histidine kinase
LALTLLLNEGLVCAASSGGVVFASNGRSYSVAVPGLRDMRARWSVTILRHDQRLVLASMSLSELDHDAGVSLSTELNHTQTDAGERVSDRPVVVEGEVVSIPFPEQGVDLLLRTGKPDAFPSVWMQAGVRNTGSQTIRLASSSPLEARLRVEGRPTDWLLTGLHVRSPVVMSLAEMGAYVKLVEYGGCYRADGTGFICVPTGPPVAYVDQYWNSRPHDWSAMGAWDDMDEVEVRPGETRWGQQVALVMDKPQAALAHWAAGVGASHGARLDKPALSGWSSWNLFGAEVTGQDVLGACAAVKESDGRLRPDVIQIDAFKSAESFPEGLSYYAKRIAETGARPGIRMQLQSDANAAEGVQAAVREGFSYLKLGGIPARSGPENLTSLERMREGLARVREAAGTNTYLLWCDLPQDRATIGVVDASRTGREALRSDVRNAINDVLLSYHLNGRWFAIDNDSYYLGTDLPNVSEIAGGWPLVRTWMSMVGLSGGAAITCDPWHWDSFKPYLRSVEVMTPPARETAEVLDLCTAREWPRLLGRVQRPWANANVALLWNPSTKEGAVTLDFARAGMDPRRRYAVWSFWDDRYLGVAEGSWTTPRLEASASQHLVFTELGRSSDRPVFIGSSLHIYCGAAEIANIESRHGRMKLSLTDAGARDGHLYVYSRFQPILRKALGCTVDGITSAGENVWRISVRGREHGQPQSIEMGILLPVTRQFWFWSSLAAVAGSLMFAAWRYVVGLREERGHALERERTRISRDLHDDLGAELSSVVMLSDLARDGGSEEVVHARLHELANQAQQTVRRLEEIVWALNPANDNLESFVSFFCKRAQNHLELAGVAVRFDVPDQMPDRQLSSLQRHNLLLAAKEALHNAVRHGNPGEIRIRVTLANEHVQITIADNGRGFVDRPELLRAHGSNNMRQRMEQIGGNFHRTSTPGQGVVVTLTVPVQRK